MAHYVIITSLTQIPRKVTWSHIDRFLGLLSNPGCTRLNVAALPRAFIDGAIG